MSEAEMQLDLLGRLRAHLGLKLALLASLAAVFCGLYFSIERLPWLHPRVLSLSWLDRALGFHPWTIYAYQSLYLLMPLLPFLATDKEDLFRFAKGFLLLSGICFVIFLAFPVLGPRPEYAGGNWMMLAVFSYDRNVNVFPSLHAGLAVYSAMFGFAMSGSEQPFYRRMAIVCAIWSTVVLYATLATKQHYFIDLPPAVALAWMAHRWAWRAKQAHA